MKRLNCSLAKLMLRIKDSGGEYHFWESHTGNKDICMVWRDRAGNYISAFEESDVVYSERHNMWMNMVNCCIQLNHTYCEYLTPRKRK